MLIFAPFSAVQKILEKIPPNNSKLTCESTCSSAHAFELTALSVSPDVWEQYLFHYVSESGIVYLVMADDSVGRRIPFAFLSRLMELIPTSIASNQSSSGSSSTTPSHHALQLEYEDKLEALMNEFNQDPTRASNDALTNAQNELNQVKDIMVHNVEQILSRGERIELLVDKTDNFAQQAVAFRRGARAQRRRMWWRNQKIVWLSFLVGLIVLYLIVASFCGLGLNHCRK